MSFFRRSDKRQGPFEFARILVPLVISDSDLDRGLELLEESLVDAGAGPG